MTLGAIELTPDEKALLARIKLDPLAMRGDPDAFRENGKAVVDLMASLIEREAIPEARRRYFQDPEYNPGGRGKSRKNVFEKNGTHGRAIFEHGSFLKYLRYFLYGAQLPPAVIERFAAEVSDCAPVTSGDVVPLGKFARQQARAARLKPHEASEEFYKLALDCDLSEDYSRHIRDAVKSLR